VTQTDGSALRYNTKASLLNPDFFAMGDASLNWIERLPPMTDN